MITRRQAIAASASAIAARPAVVAAATTVTDRGPLAGLVAYQQEVVFGYAVALRRGPFNARERRMLQRFHDDSAQAAAALRKALEDEGGTPSPPPDPATAPPPRDPSKRGYLADLIEVEEMAVGGYYLSMQNLEAERHLRGAAAFMAQAGARLVVLRHQASRPLLPRAFETGSG